MLQTECNVGESNGRTFNVINIMATYCPCASVRLFRFLGLSIWYMRRS